MSFFLNPLLIVSKEMPSICGMVNSRCTASAACCRFFNWLGTTSATARLRTVIVKRSP
jgi:hypothetical protein